MLPSPNNSKRTPQNAAFLVMGLFLGFMASSFLSMMAVCQDDSQRILDSSTSWPIFSTQRLAQNSRASSTAPSVALSSLNKTDIGWSNVAVYYGTRDHLVNVSDIPYPYYHSNKWFSQVRQDELVISLLQRKRQGYFVDLAANDAIRISNTYALETQYDWTGLCIEPNAIYWPSLSYRTCQVVGAVVGSSQSQEVQFQFRQTKGERGGIVLTENDKLQQNNSATTKVRRGSNDATQPRMTISLLEILQRFHSPSIIDYLSLDVEGAEFLILRDFPFDLYRFNLLTIERPNPKLSQLLERNGYVFLKKLKRWGETLWAHRDIESQLDKSALLVDTWDYRIRFTAK